MEFHEYEIDIDEPCLTLLILYSEMAIQVIQGVVKLIQELLVWISIMPSTVVLFWIFKT